MENGSITELLLSEGGKLFRRTINQTEIAIDEGVVFSALKDNQNIWMRDALFIQKQPVGLCIVSDKNGTLHVDGTIPIPIAIPPTG